MYGTTYGFDYGNSFGLGAYTGGFVPWNQIGYDAQTTGIGQINPTSPVFLEAQAKAKLNGWEAAEKVMELISKYGTPIIGLLLQNKVMKNANGLYSNQVDDAALASFLGDTGGTGNPSNYVQGSGNSLLGLNQNTLMIGGIIIALVYYFSTQTTTKKR